jgi:hypothetical protein
MVVSVVSCHGYQIVGIDSPIGIWLDDGSRKF